MNKFLILFSCFLFFLSCDGMLSPELVRGCTFDYACNYNPDAVIYDASCTYASDDGEGAYTENTSDGESTVFDCDGVCLVDSDSDGFCEDFDICPDDPLNDCFPEEGYTYLMTFDWYCYNNPNSTYIIFYGDGTWTEENGSSSGTWGLSMGSITLDTGLCASELIDVDLWMTFDNYNTYYYWDLEGAIGTNSIEGYHDQDYGNGLGNVDGITSLTLYNAALHGDMDNLMNQNTSQNPAYFKNIKNNEQ